ncbi:MAG TPA: putative porin [Flavisolibacter sp.]|nr:putative porin [Flavisolibacter sp.]
MKKAVAYKGLFLLLVTLSCLGLHAQRPSALEGITRRIGNLGSTGASGGPGGDSLRSRSKDEEHLTLSYYYLDSSRAHHIDSSILDYSNYYPVPATHINLGNTGTATRSILYAPNLRAGFDPGFHAFDVYKFKVETASLFNTTKPYTQLSYNIATRAEQIIELLLAQNLKPYWSASFQYRMIGAPGTFRNQKTSHNSYQFTSWYQAPSKRYNNYFVIVSNKLQSQESGGIQKTSDLHDPVFSADRYTIPTFLGGDPRFATNFFNTTVYTGNRYNETNFLLRQQYDFGKKDSLVTDSTVIPLFFPRVRFEHTINYGKYRYIFQDLPVSTADQRNSPDSAYYASRYNIIFPTRDSFIKFQDQWREVTNDFSIYQFPDVKNLQQFIKVGAELQLLSGEVRRSRSLYNVMGHGEYRNRTKNQKWDIAAFGKLWFNGYNSGDYHAYISLQRLISPNVGSLQVGFENVNRTPPFIYNGSSNFYLDDPAKTFSKENTLHFFGSVFQPKLRIQLSADYYLISNYLYITDFYKLQQEATLFNVLRINALKTFNIGRHWKWHAQVYLQQKTGAADIHFPTIYTRNLFGYEGTLGFPHLNIAFGTEVRYHTPYKADNYSPVLGQFFYQDSVTIDNNPRIDFYLNFRIRSFKAFLRFENLNTASTVNGFGFTNNDFAAPGYPTPGMITRFGIYWSFIN